MSTSKNPKIIVYVGDITVFLREQIKLEHESATLITSENFQNLLPGVYYVSIGDLDNLGQFGEILRQAHEIHYRPPDKWSDGNVFSSTMKKWTEDYLSVFACHKDKILTGYNIDVPDVKEMIELVDYRVSNSKQIWVAGCSISNGKGVSHDQRYGHLISQKMNLPVSFLTRNGSSIAWAADQILRSDIRPGDLVFWGITSVHRFTAWNEFNKKISCCTPNSKTWKVHKKTFKNYFTEKFICSDHTLYQSINSIHQVINFCEKINVQLIMASLIRDMEPFLKDMDNFILLAGEFGRNINDVFVDLGDDNIHPGPRSHQYYADRMLERHYQINGK
jgi:hypothetical protein